MLRSHLNLSLAVALLALAPLASQAGQILIDDSTTGSPTITNGISTAYGASCFASAGVYDHCSAYIRFNTAGSAVAAQIIDDATSASVTIPVSQGSTEDLLSSNYADSTNPALLGDGFDIQVSATGPVIFGFSFFGYAEPFQASELCGSYCSGLESGSSQTAYTINWLDSSSGVISTDTVAFIGQTGSGVSATPEPSTALLLLPGLALLIKRAKLRR